MSDRAQDFRNRDRLVRRNLVLEGLANVAVLVLKAVVGFSTGSMAILGDALHSLTDVANNVVALAVVRHSAQPADSDHPYGHRKFETLAVFVLGTLLAVLALEIGIRALTRDEPIIQRQGWGLAVMLGVLAANIAITLWQGWWARRLDSPILSADARHTFADVLTTVVVIVGWQFASAGHLWVDKVAAIAVAGLVLVLAFGLFRRSVPILVDTAAIQPTELRATVDSVDGVLEVRTARSRHTGSSPAVDVVVSVDPHLTTTQAHEIADSIEALIRERFSAEDIVVHVEPHQ